MLMRVRRDRSLRTPDCNLDVEKELSPHTRAAVLELEKCTSCGLCKDVCPVFNLSKREAESPRGKINLLRALLDESLDPAQGSVDVFNRCLLCYACQDACPAGVLTSRIWIAARQILADEVGRPFAKSFFLRRVLPGSGLKKAALTMSRKLPGDENAVRLRGTLFPRPAQDRLNRILPEVNEPQGRLIGTVALFPGCLISEIYPYLGVQAVDLLTFLGYRVILPHDRACCGAPAFNNGDMDAARKLAEKNLQLFTALDVDAILSPDATCGGAFTHEYEMLFPSGSQWRTTYSIFRDRVVNFAEFIGNAVVQQGILAFQPLPVELTVHDSCHMKYLQQKSHIPRRLMEFIPGLKIIESPQSGLCCGFGGSYSILFPAESRAITRRKLEYIRRSGSRTVMVGSPGCLWRLRSEAALLGLNLRIVHYLELLWESLLGERSDASDRRNAETGAEIHLR